MWPADWGPIPGFAEIPWKRTPGLFLSHGSKVLQLNLSHTLADIIHWLCVGCPLLSCHYLRLILSVPGGEPVGQCIEHGLLVFLQPRSYRSEQVANIALVEAPIDD